MAPRARGASPTGGTNSVNGTLWLGYYSGSSGTYNLDGGLLIIQGLYRGIEAFNFNGGTLQAGGGFSTFASMTLGAGAGATFETAGFAVTLSNSLYGAGSLTKVDSGTLILAGATATRERQRSAGGTLSLANLGALAGGGNITFAGGTLQSSSNNNQDYSANIPGSTGLIAIDTNGVNITFASGLAGNNRGGLNKIGSGVLTLAASNGYSGTTTITGGTLQMGNGGNGASIGGTSAVINNASLIFNHADAVVFNPDRQRQRQFDANRFRHTRADECEFVYGPDHHQRRHAADRQRRQQRRPGQRPGHG